MRTSFEIGQIVKYSKPQEGEDNLRFIVKEIHEASENLGEKLHVELICNDYLKPKFCYFSNEFTAI